MHNDSTSASVHGAYESADRAPRRGKPTPAVTFGHSKEHRPDLKQSVWILTVWADGSVPMAYRIADGNTSDDPTYIPTWDALVRVLGRRDFLYVTDSKLCSGQAMRHIDGAGGRLVTVLPRIRCENKWFRDWIGTNQPPWGCTPPSRPHATSTPAAAASRPAPRHRRAGHQTGRAKDQAQDPCRRRAGHRQGAGRHRLGPLAAGWRSRDDAIAHDAAGDGCFPLITIDRQLTETEVLASYRYQPNLERCHHLLKSVQDADPIWLRDPAQIEAIFCCQFMALLVGALIERQIRTAMKQPPPPRISALPIATSLRSAIRRTDLRSLGRPDPPRSAPRRAARADLRSPAHPLQQQILDLLGVPATANTRN